MPLGLGRFLVIGVSKGPPGSRQLPFGPRHGSSLVYGQLHGRGRLKVPPSAPAFLSPFGCRRSLPEPSFPAMALSPPYGRLTEAGQLSGPRRGFRVPHM
ncbi:hypothetical protein FRACA_5470002 [Frankia canadensis]|uniref:Uncharacterized protein n=1 Tax=Frankia canadensis TaxID=1836972 RepID=A0A2I2KYV1_9ACTN|nr:hypothetical protein FRACA_5470002 [Frankia canadensis]SOU58134.1 hypothetical protein FRACA_5470002 [Frankia canadensis]